MFFTKIIFNFFFENWLYNPGSESKLGQNPGSKFNVFESTTLDFYDVHRVCRIITFVAYMLYRYTINQEKKCSGDFEILHVIVHDATRKSEKYEIIREVSRTISCSTSESPLHHISFLTV